MVPISLNVVPNQAYMGRKTRVTIHPLIIIWEKRTSNTGSSWSNSCCNRWHFDSHCRSLWFHLFLQCRINRFKDIVGGCTLKGEESAEINSRNSKPDNILPEGSVPSLLISWFHLTRAMAFLHILAAFVGLVEMLLLVTATNGYLAKENKLLCKFWSKKVCLFLLFWLPSLSLAMQ